MSAGGVFLAPKLFADLCPLKKWLPASGLRKHVSFKVHTLLSGKQLLGKDFQSPPQGEDRRKENSDAGEQLEMLGLMAENNFETPKH